MSEQEFKVRFNPGKTEDGSPATEIGKQHFDGVSADETGLKTGRVITNNGKQIAEFTQFHQIASKDPSGN